MRRSLWDALWGLSIAAIVGGGLLLFALSLVGVEGAGAAAIVYPAVMTVLGVIGCGVLWLRRPAVRAQQTSDTTAVEEQA